MKNLIFHRSTELTLGVELELQLINPQTQELSARAKNVIRNICHSQYHDNIKPEVTQGMIELNSSVQTNPQSVHEELFKIARFLSQQMQELGAYVSGGGAHPFQNWREHKIFPSPRFKRLSWKYRYLSKRFTTFGLHFHIGCKDGNDAIYLTHSLARFIPHFIALSAASPFYQGADTGFNSSRVNVVSAFPTSGYMPFVLNWREFSEYYFKMRNLKVVDTMKDFYWDIRPKPTFGTIEVRICDTPLTLERAIMIVAYAQTLAGYLLREKPLPLSHDLYYLYHYNRFQASRYGYEGILIDPFTFKKLTLAEDILTTLPLLKSFADKLNTANYMRKIHALAKHQQNDAHWIRNVYAKSQNFNKLILKQCELWRDQFNKHPHF